MEDKAGKISSELVKFLKVDINAMENELSTPGSVRQIVLDQMTQKIYKMYENDDFEKCSLKELEEYAVFLHRHKYHIPIKIEDILRSILAIRRGKLDCKYFWNEENIKRLLEVNNRFIKCWEIGFVEAKAKMNLLYEQMMRKDSFLKDYEVCINLQPQILVWDDSSKEYECPDNSIFDVLDYMLYLVRMEIRMNNVYNPATGDDSKFYKNGYINRATSWNIESFDTMELSEHYISYALHKLCDNYWAIEDILKINQIHIEVNVSYQSSTEIF